MERGGGGGGGEREREREREREIPRRNERAGRLATEWMRQRKVTIKVMVQ